MKPEQVVSQAEWLQARLELMAREKAFTQEREALAAARRALPWVRVEAEYRFDSAEGEVGLADLFGSSSQLIAYHFMFDTDWEAGCPSCSFWADNYNGVLEHLAARDVALAVVSKAPLEKLLAFRERMGWRFNWVSSPNNIFGRDFGVSFSEEQLTSGEARYNLGTSSARMPESPGVSVFARDGDAIYHTYSSYARGLDVLNGAYHHLDIVPGGRDEADLPFSMAWVRRRDEYAKP